MEPLTSRHPLVLMVIPQEHLHSQILAFLSSEASECNEKEFKENYATSTKFAEKALYKLTQVLLHE